MRRSKPRRALLPQGLLLALLMGMVVVPAVLSLSVGIVAIALWREAFDIVFGVLILSFAAASVAGGAVAIVYVRRGARLVSLQADFVANVSHELRTPLAGIRLVADTLEAGRGDDPERLRVLTEMLGDEVRRLEDLIERVLTWRQLEAGALGAAAQELLSADALLRDVVASVRHLPEARGVTLHVDVAPDLPPLRGERTALWHALSNVVHNAMKFGGAHGPVEIEARRTESEIQISVRDRGPGIDKEELARVFDRFYRGRRPATVRGTGLGLSIVRSVVESHAGKVEIDSAPGQGTVCTVRLPAAVDAEAAVDD